ncbi:uncharacterized protein LOC131653029 [Vicia villosa]|uniref:uncharacterized protein LOC131653029 n=1 Tax=Vicia villosa TaxID=3911 RepID=UPI00273CD0F5|nr:uncharacterized protein LOC131653029 [Vicia villosa]
MNGYSQNSFRGGWNNMPPTDFSEGQIPHGIGGRAFADDWHIPHQMPGYYAHNWHIPRQAPVHYGHNRYIPHQAPAHYVYNRNLRHQTPTHHADNRHLSHKKHLPHPTSIHYADNRNLSQQTPKDGADKKCLPQQTPKDCADKKCLPQQTPEDCANKKCLPQQTPEDCADKKCLPQQTPKDCADKKCLPQQTPEDCANKKCLQDEIRDLKKFMKNHKKRKRHEKKLLKQQSTKHKTSSGEEIRHNQSSQISKEANASKKNSTEQTPEVHADKQCLPQQTSKDLANKKPLPHQKPEAFVDNKCLPHQMSEHYADKTNSLQQAPKDYAKKKSLPPIIHCEICYVQFHPSCLKDHNNGKKHQRSLLELRKKSMKPKDSNGKEISHIQSSQISPVVQPKNVPAEMSKRKVRDNTDAKDHGFKHEIEGATGGKYMKMNNGIRGSVKNDQPQSTPVELKASAGANIIVKKEYISCDLAATVIPQGHVASHVSTPPPAVESSFEPKNHIDLPREVTVAKEHHKVQKYGVETNDEPQLISRELQSFGCCKISSVAEDIRNNQTEVVNSDSTGMETYIETLASLMPDAVGSSFEPVTEYGLDTETEPHMSEAILYTESQHAAEETDIELLPPVLMEIDVALGVSAETKTADGNSQAKTKMDVELSPESGKTKLRKVSVCLMCGNKGFEKAIVYCSKCGDYAMHRYCLARPVALTDKVTWFCIDCEEVVVKADHPNSETPKSEKDDVVFDPQPIADPIWRGSLQVFNKSFDRISGLMGHLSTLASPKVLEEASHLPDVLYANLLQRSAVWPESFKKFGTNNQSIGLYFFPENERVERYYDQLVDEMISKDLAIRVMVEKTELIIFPSTLLPRQYKRFHSKYYLWGIFKRKQVSRTIKDT